MTSLAVIDQPQPSRLIAPLPADQPVSTFATKEAYTVALAQARSLATSTIVPEAYRGNEANCLLAIELATRVGASPFMVMQNVHIIGGRPSWSSPFIIAAINACGRFGPLRFRLEKRGERDLSYTEWVGPKGDRKPVQKTVKAQHYTCVAFARDKETGETIEGPEVTTEMAAMEGWWGKSDSKWRTMPEVMIRYRAAAFFGRFYAPDILMGMQTAEEVDDITGVPSQWADPMDDRPPLRAEVVVDDTRDAFEAVLAAAAWTDNQRSRLRARYAAAEAEGRAALVAEMQAHAQGASDA